VNFASKKQRRPVENVVPLINVVFLLLIFFMLAGSLRPVEPFAVELPQAAGEREAAERGAEIEAEGSVLFVAASGELALDGQRLDEATLLTALAARSGDSSLELRADAGIPARRFLPLLGRLRAAGVAELELVVADDR
jgi:biopolymer transport protein ExbD